VNVGSPDAPTPSAVRRYLREFLGDPAVVDANRFVWWFVLHGLILPLRSRTSARLYRSIWTPEGSPLVAISRRQRELLAAALGPRFQVALGMRYGRPSIREALDELGRAGCRELVLVPLFPQKSRATFGTVERAVRAELARDARGFELRLIEPFFEEEAYIEALAARVHEAQALGPVDHHVFSFHGLPVRYVESGDPYRDQCERTARALAARLALAPEHWTLVYQSRFGREPWLEPYAAERVPALAKEHRRVLVACPGFMADCLETLEEIGVRLRESFEAAGGLELRLAACVNDHPLGIAALAREVERAAPRGASHP